MRTFQHIDPIALKAFFYAAETLNFTQAAIYAGLTQSGVSQHIARLEHHLGTELFIRQNRKVQLTLSGHQLKTFAENYLDSVHDLLEKLREETVVIKGPVRYAMPPSCLMTPHFPMLLDRREQLGEIELDVQLCHSRIVSDLLQKGEIDFGFLTQNLKHKDLDLRPFGAEDYVLVSALPSQLKWSRYKEIKELPFISYPGMDELFENWSRAYFPGHNAHALNELQVRGHINSLTGAITMAEKGLGLGIFPRHCVQEQILKKKLFVYQVKQERDHLHTIYLVTRKNQRPTARVQKVIDLFWEIKSS